MSTADQVLFERWSKARDAEAFTELTRRYAGMVHASCLRVLQNRSDAEDATLECFEKLGTLRRGPQGHMGAWLHRMAVNAALDRLRSDRRRKEREQRYSDAQPQNAEPSWHDLYEHVDEAIAALPDNLRGPIVAHFLDNETHAAIAEREGVTRSAITQRIDRGIEALRDNLRKRGVLVGAATLATLLTENAQAEPLPAALAQALGKLALSGMPGAAVAASATAAWWLAAGALTAITVIAVAAYITLHSQAPPSIPVSTSAPATPVAAPNLPASDSAAPEPQSPSPDGAGAGTRFVGRVYDAATGTGIADIEMVARKSFNGKKFYDAPPAARTDRDGRYELSVPCGGVWDIDARSLVPYVAIPSAKASVTDGRTTDGVDFALVRGYRVAGRVVDADGRPVPGAKVQGFSNNAGFSAESKSDGTFEAAVAPHAKGLQIWATLNKDPASQMASFAHGPYDVCQSGLEGLIVPIYEAASLTGRIIDAQGQPVRGVSALARLVTYPGAGDPKVSPMPKESGGESDEIGRFEIPLRHPGTYALSILGRGKSVELAQVEVKERDRLLGFELQVPDDLEVSPREAPVEAPYKVVGIVVGSDGQPLEEASVRTETAAGQGPWTLTGEDGRFETDATAREGINITVEGTGHCAATLKDLKADGAEVRIVLQPRNDLEVRVVRNDTGEPVKQFQALVQPGAVWGGSVDVEAALAPTALRLISTLSVTGSLHTDGVFRVESLEPGPKLVVVRAPGMKLGLLCLTVPPAKQGPARGVLRLKPDDAPITGRVVDSQGRPVPGADLWLDGRPVISSSDAAMGQRESLGQTDPQGAFTLTGLLPGNLMTFLAAYHPDYAPASCEIEIGKAAPPVLLKLPATGVIEGRITQAGQPLADVDLSCTYQSESPSAYDSTKSAGDGSFRFDRALPGTVRLQAHIYQGRDVYRELDAKVAAGRVAPITLELPTGTATLEGTVTVDGVPAAWVGVDMFLPVSEGRARIQATFNGNRYRIEALPPGACTVQVNGRAEDSDGTETETSLTLTEGQTTVQDFAL